ncbi:hypothetical protein GS870_24365 [Rhodococcus hoagii]|nr:hypothetical protein [Prescottella equi]
MRTSVVTVVSGRHDHLRTQLRRLRGSTVAAHDHVVVAMGDRAVTDIVAEHSDATRSVWIPASTDELPLARHATSERRQRSTEGRICWCSWTWTASHTRGCSVVTSGAPRRHSIGTRCCAGP